MLVTTYQLRSDEKFGLDCRSSGTNIRRNARWHDVTDRTRLQHSPERVVKRQTFWSNGRCCRHATCGTADELITLGRTKHKKRARSVARESRHSCYSIIANVSARLIRLPVMATVAWLRALLGRCSDSGNSYSDNCSSRGDRCQGEARLTTRTPSVLSTSFTRSILSFYSSSRRRAPADTSCRNSQLQTRPILTLNNAWLVLGWATTKEYHPRLCIDYVDFTARYKYNYSYTFTHFYVLHL